jgi:hypothetical protein
LRLGEMRPLFRGKLRQIAKFRLSWEFSLGPLVSNRNPGIITASTLRVRPGEIQVLHRS